MSPASTPGTGTVVVAGDVTVDWTLMRARRPAVDFTNYQYIWGSDIATRACSQAGGAALLASIIEAIAARDAPQVQVLGATLSADTLRDPACGAFTRSYSVWAPFPRGSGDKKTVWRASEFWGSDPADVPGPPQPQHGAARPDGIVIDDVNLGFRTRTEDWPEAIRQPSPTTRWIIVKVADPIAQGPLWDHLVRHFADRLIVVAPVSELRKAHLTIGYGLSWEQTSGEICRAVAEHPELRRAATAVVPLGTSGAVVSTGAAGRHLVFDPRTQEEDWRRDHPGTCVGYASCCVAALARHFMTGARTSIVDAVRIGVHAARTLHLVGYGDGDGKGLGHLGFPLAQVLDALRTPDPPLAVLPLDEVEEPWTILERRLPVDSADLSARVVRLGPEATLGEVPIERIGNWMSVDRAEIESVRSLRNIMTEYVGQSRPSRPLSLAVFGPPGAGKSFAVKEAARALMPGKLTTIEFNLSQFESADELVASFHRVRDAVLRGELPLVFWDEFDTPLGGRELGWLRYFLAPMQDGEFREAGVLHPLGPAVFVFAGGVFATLAGFRQAAEANPVSKGRDFVSRLRGFLNILGPNARDASDRFHVLRRALLLRSLLRRKAGHLFAADGTLHMDEGVLRAFLLAPAYRHGARSMECVIDMSALSGKLLFERSCLPAPDQLDLHVDGAQFLAIVRAGSEAAGV